MSDDFISEMTKAIDILGDVLLVCQISLDGISLRGNEKQKNLATKTLTYINSRKPDLDKQLDKVQEAIDAFQLEASI